MNNMIGFFIKRLLITMSFGTLLILTSCASMPAPQVDSRILVWKSVSIDELVKYWGLPNRQSKIGESHVAEWINQKSSNSNTAISVGTGSYGRNSSIGLGLTLFNLGGGDDVCQRQVTYSIKGEILNIIWSGDTDFCFELTPDKNLVYKKNNETP